MEVRDGPVQPVEAGEVVTDENVYDRPDETMGFFPGQVVADLTASAILLAVVVALSYLVPAGVGGAVDRSRGADGGRRGWLWMLCEEMVMLVPGDARIAWGGIII